MDPLTLISTALVAGAATALKDTTTQAVKDAYNALKNLIARKFAHVAPVSAALTMVESKPDDTARRQMLEDELKVARVDQDGEVLKLAQTLAEAIKQHAPQVAQQYNVTGSGAAAVGPGARAVGAGGVIVDGNHSGNINTGTQMTNNYYGHPPADPADAAGSGLIASVEGRKLYQLLNDYFNLSEIEGLCFEMGIDDENLRGETKAGKARALVQHVEAQSRQDELKKLMRVQRPNLRNQLQ